MIADLGAILWAGGNASAGRDGDGALLYPGPEGPLPSVRLLNIADGVEDAQLFGALPASQRLGLVSELVPSRDQYFNDPERMEAVRRRAARLAMRAAE